MGACENWHQNSGFPPKTGKVTVPRGSGVDPFYTVDPNKSIASNEKGKPFWGPQKIGFFIEKKESTARSDHFRCSISIQNRPLSSTFQAFWGIFRHHFVSTVRHIGPATVRLQLLPRSHRVLENHRKVVEENKTVSPKAICVHISWWFMVTICDYVMLMNGFTAFHTWKPVNGKVGSDMMSVSVNGKALKPNFFWTWLYKDLTRIPRIPHGLLSSLITKDCPGGGHNHLLGMLFSASKSRERWNRWNLQPETNHKVLPQFGIAKLVNITPIKPMVYGRYIYS